MVEFSLLLLPFLLVIIGIIEISYVWSAKQAITNAAREGARVLLLPYGNDQFCPDIDCSSAESLQEAARQTARNFLQNAGVRADEPYTQILLIRQKVETDGTVSSEALAGSIVSGDRVGVEIRHHYSSLLQGFFSSDSAAITLRGTSVMRHE
ncbi:MAG: TadE family protein [Blastocatellia bacterium]